MLVFRECVRFYSHFEVYAIFPSFYSSRFGFFARNLNVNTWSSAIHWTVGTRWEPVFFFVDLLNAALAFLKDVVFDWFIGWDYTSKTGLKSFFAWKWNNCSLPQPWWQGGYFFEISIQYKRNWKLYGFQVTNQTYQCVPSSRHWLDWQVSVCWWVLPWGFREFFDQGWTYLEMQNRYYPLVN